MEVREDKRRSKGSNQVRRKQEIGNALLDFILVLTVAADEVPLLDARLNEQGVQVSKSLAVVVGDFVGRWDSEWQGWEAELFFILSATCSLSDRDGDIDSPLEPDLSWRPSLVGAGCCGGRGDSCPARPAQARRLLGGGEKLRRFACMSCARR